MLEKKIEKTVTQYAESQGWLSFKFSSPSHRGVPDRIYMSQGKTLFIEFKAPGKKPTALQDYTCEKIRQHGIPVFIISDIDAGKYVFDHA